MDRDHTIAVITKLAAICKDDEKGYKDAAQHAKRSDLKGFFITESTERGRFATELQSVLTKLGNTGKKASGTVAGALQRVWVEAKVILGAGDKTILEFVEKGEDEVNEAYQEAVCVLLPSDVAEIVRRQARSVQTAQDRVKNLRDRLAA